jgi:hypothetical protein
MTSKLCSAMGDRPCAGLCLGKRREAPVMPPEPLIEANSPGLCKGSDAGAAARVQAWQRAPRYWLSNEL